MNIISYEHYKNKNIIFLIVNVLLLLISSFKLLRRIFAIITDKLKIDGVTNYLSGNRFVNPSSEMDYRIDHRVTNGSCIVQTLCHVTFLMHHTVYMYLKLANIYLKLTENLEACAL